MDYWQFADAVFADAARSIARYGITGFRNAWAARPWRSDGHFEFLPIEHFLYLAALVEYRAPVKAMPLAEELRLLHKIMANHPPNKSIALN